MKAKPVLIIPLLLVFTIGLPLLLGARDPIWFVLNMTALFITLFTIYALFAIFFQKRTKMGVYIIIVVLLVAVIVLPPLIDANNITVRLITEPSICEKSCAQQNYTAFCDTIIAENITCADIAPCGQLSCAGLQ